MKKFSLAILILAILMVFLFTYFPDLDVAVARLVMDQSPASTTGWYQWVYLIVRPITFLTVGILLIDITICLVTGKHVWLPAHSAVFFLLCWLLGPGLLVNIVLKDHIGRPRPSQIVEFDGEVAYVAPFHLSVACHKNCSFVSGHASVGFVFVALAFIFHAHRYAFMMAAVTSGTLIGYVRMAQGGHFLSDVVFSFLFTYMGVYCAYLTMRCLDKDVQYDPGVGSVGSD